MTVLGETEQALGRPGLFGVEVRRVCGLGQFFDGRAEAFFRQGLLAVGEGLLINGLAGHGLLGLVEEGIVASLFEEAQVGAFDALEPLQCAIVVMGGVEFLGLFKQLLGRDLRRLGHQMRSHDRQRCPHYNHHHQDFSEFHRTSLCGPRQSDTAPHLFGGRMTTFPILGRRFLAVPSCDPLTTTYLPNTIL